ncbi:DUF721 domain-containing protein [Paracoccus suum]|uniref:DUF721 domain-containing protein n=2 Tax=Paracoccus suum TaxID=2259340 RepID=A0A344PGK8_9RHOB|nr:DUF721 domain-containing protein [Paracoccus suum]
MRGFEPAAGLLADAVRRAGEGRGFAVARLLTHWPEVVGRDIAMLCRPVRMTHARNAGPAGASVAPGATLVLLTTGPNAPRLEMMLPQIRERVNACYGWNAVSRVTLTQTAPAGFAEGQAVFARPTAPEPPTPGPEALDRARAAAEGIDDPTLAAAVARFATLYLSHRDTIRKARQS